MDCVCLPFMGKTKYLSVFERGMVVGAKRTNVCVKNRVYQEWSDKRITCRDGAPNVPTMVINGYTLTRYDFTYVLKSELLRTLLTETSYPQCTHVVVLVCICQYLYFLICRKCYINSENPIKSSSSLYVQLVMVFGLL
jgi:hypothetical protein